MNALYPLKFTPILKDKIWGGKKLNTILNKDTNNSENVGESWELSGVQNELSMVSNGFLKDNNIEELLEVYMGDIVGDKVYDKFGIEFPLLIKFIDANDWLSIQVHPDDDLARERHESYGKSEMWYVVDAEKEAELIAGFNQDLDERKYLSHFGGGTLREILNFEKVAPGDVFYMPAGRVHATGPGIMFAEIQQTSDITYRIYDWDRFDANGDARELHTDLAIEAIDFDFCKEYKTPYAIVKNQNSEIISTPFFKTNVLQFDANIICDYALIDSFVIYMCIEGEAAIYFDENKAPEIIKKGETILMPAVLKYNTLKPLSAEVKMLEVYIP